MKYYFNKSNSNQDRALDTIGDAFNAFFKPIFYDEKLDSMKTDIKETDKSYELEVELPGFSKEDISISLEEQYLTISAEKTEKQEDESDKHRYLRKERSVSCSRSFYIGDVKEDSVKASYTNGVLEVSLPKLEPEPPQKRSIAIE